MKIPPFLVLILLFSLQTNAQMSYPVELEGCLSSELNTGIGIHGAVLREITPNIQCGIKAGVIQLNDMPKHCFPVAFTAQYQVTHNEMIDPFLDLEAGHGFYKDKFYGTNGGFFGYAGLGIKFNPDERLPIYTSAGLSGFEFNSPNTHVFTKRFTLRLGMQL